QPRQLRLLHNAGEQRVVRAPGIQQQRVVRAPGAANRLQGSVLNAGRKEMRSSMRTIATAVVFVLGLMVGYAHAQYVGIPKTFQPSLDAAKSRRTLKNPPLTAAPSVKDTLYRVGDALGMLRDTDERDTILTMDFKGTGTLNVAGQPCTLANFRGQL